jgi:hypothetical protein
VRYDKSVELQLRLLGAHSDDIVDLEQAESVMMKLTSR